MNSIRKYLHQTIIDSLHKKRRGKNASWELSIDIEGLVDKLEKYISKVSGGKNK